MFQFQYGAIERILELFPFAIRIMFQFQYGAIERDVNVLDHIILSKFQFQYGAIESVAKYAVDSLATGGFNSNMVRLRGM